MRPDQGSGQEEQSASVRAGRPAALSRLQQQRLERLSSRCATASGNRPTQNAGTHAEASLQGKCFRHPSVQPCMQRAETGSSGPGSTCFSQHETVRTARPACSTAPVRRGQPPHTTMPQPKDRAKRKITTVTGMMTSPPSRNSNDSSQASRSTRVRPSNNVRTPLVERQLPPPPQQQQQQQPPKQPAVKDQPHQQQHYHHQQDQQHQQHQQQVYHPQPSRSMLVKKQAALPHVEVPTLSPPLPQLAVTGHGIPAPWAELSTEAEDGQPDVRQRYRQDQSPAQAVSVRLAADVVNTAPAAAEELEISLYAVACGCHERRLKRAGLQAFFEAAAEHHTWERLAAMHSSRIAFRTMDRCLTGWRNVAQQHDWLRQKQGHLQQLREQRVLREVMRVWRATCHSVAVRKKQMLKAVYYHSFIMLLGGLQAWQAWVRQQQQKRLLYNSAAKQAQHNLKSRGWRAWRLFAAWQASKRQLTEVARCKERRRMLGRRLQAWRQRVLGQQYRQQQACSHLQHVQSLLLQLDARTALQRWHKWKCRRAWAKTMVQQQLTKLKQHKQLQVLSAWQHVVVIHDGLRKGALRLAASRDAWWLSVCWQRWAAAARLMQGSRAAELRALVQQRAVLGTWLMYVDTQKRAGVHQAAASAKLHRLKKRQCILAWWKRATDLRWKHQQQTVAAKWRRQQVLAGAMCGWQEAAVEKGARRRQQAAAAAFREGELFLKGWRAWQWRTRYSAKKQQAPLHYSRHLLRQSLSAWSGVSQQKAVQAVQWRAAVRHRYLHFLRATLMGWQQYLQRSERKRHAAAGASRLYQQSLRMKAWQAWRYRYIIRRRMNHLQQQAACSQYQKHLMSTSLSAFKGAAAAATSERVRLATAVMLANGRLLQKAWGVWQKLVEHRWQEHQQVTAAAEAAAWQLLKLRGPRVLQAWKVAAGALQEQRFKVRDFQQSQGCRQRRCLFDAWRVWAQQRRAAAVAKANASGLYERQLGLKALAAWRAGRACLVQERSAAAAAALHWRRAVLKRTLRAWRLSVLTNQTLLAIPWNTALSPGAATSVAAAAAAEVQRWASQAGPELETYGSGQRLLGPVLQQDPWLQQMQQGQGPHRWAGQRNMRGQPLVRGLQQEVPSSIGSLAAAAAPAAACPGPKPAARQLSILSLSTVTGDDGSGQFMRQCQEEHQQQHVEAGKQGLYPASRPSRCQRPPPRLPKFLVERMQQQREHPLHHPDASVQPSGSVCLQWQEQQQQQQGHPSHQPTTPTELSGGIRWASHESHLQRQRRDQAESAWVSSWHVMSGHVCQLDPFASPCAPQLQPVPSSLRGIPYDPSMPTLSANLRLGAVSPHEPRGLLHHVGASQSYTARPAAAVACHAALQTASYAAVASPAAVPAAGAAAAAANVPAAGDLSHRVSADRPGFAGVRQRQDHGQTARRAPRVPSFARGPLMGTSSTVMTGQYKVSAISSWRGCCVGDGGWSAEGRWQGHYGAAEALQLHQAVGTADPVEITAAAAGAMVLQVPVWESKDYREMNGQQEQQGQGQQQEHQQQLGRPPTMCQSLQQLQQEQQPIRQQEQQQELVDPGQQQNSTDGQSRVGTCMVGPQQTGGESKWCGRAVPHHNGSEPVPFVAFSQVAAAVTRDGETQFGLKSGKGVSPWSVGCGRTEPVGQEGKQQQQQGRKEQEQQQGNAEKEEEEQHRWEQQQQQGIEDQQRQQQRAQEEQQKRCSVGNSYPQNAQEERQQRAQQGKQQQRKRGVEQQQEYHQLPWNTLEPAAAATYSPTARMEDCSLEASWRIASILQTFQQQPEQQMSKSSLCIDFDALVAQSIEEQQSQLQKEQGEADDREWRLEQEQEYQQGWTHEQQQEQHQLADLMLQQEQQQEQDELQQDNDESLSGGLLQMDEGKVSSRSSSRVSSVGELTQELVEERISALEEVLQRHLEGKQAAEEAGVVVVQLRDLLTAALATAASVSVHSSSVAGGRRQGGCGGSDVSDDEWLPAGDKGGPGVEVLGEGGEVVLAVGVCKGPKQRGDRSSYGGMMGDEGAGEGCMEEEEVCLRAVAVPVLEAGEPRGACGDAEGRVEQLAVELRQAEGRHAALVAKQVEQRGELVKVLEELQLLRLVASQELMCEEQELIE